MPYAADDPSGGIRMTSRLFATVLLLVGMAAHPAHAQYFGQNKVQYENFDFQVLATEHFDIYYYPEEAEAVQVAARMAERWYARLSVLLGHELSSRQPLILYAAHPHFQQTNVLGGDIGEGTGGVTESAKRRVIMPFAGGLAETDHVLGHEIVHAFQYDIADSVTAEGGRGAGMMAMPLWFVEGMAEYLSLGPVDANTAMWVRDAAAREKMPSIGQLDDPDFFPYRYGHAFWAYVAARWGDGAVANMLRAVAASGSLEAAFEGVLGITRDEFAEAWHEETNRSFAPFFETTRPPTAFGRTLMTRDTSGGELNLAPAVSPDGRRLVFLSERSLFAIEMYVADVATGKVERRLVRTAGDPHFDSLQFIESAGDWAPDNRRFVFSALRKGQPVLVIADTTTGNREAEHEFRDVDQIYNPAWSPDGRRIAFSAMAGGLLDLYIFDLETRQLTRLTSDAFADYDPEWSPNGRELAWVTDRFTANTQALSFGGYQIGLIDVASGQARRLAGFDNGRNTNPEFSADGRSLYFIATPDGIPNVYRVDAAGGTPEPLTNVLSGVSGITPLTPALSVAARADTVIFSVFEANHYNLYAVEGGTAVTGRSAPPSDRNAAVLPPFNRTEGQVAQLLQAPAQGLPRPTEYPEREYRAGLSLDAVAQPTVGVGADRFGAYAAGGISLLWSDMLGNHQLATTVQLTNRFEEFGGAVAYINRENRWNWGIVGEQSPYVTGGFAQFSTIIDGQRVFIEEELRITQISRGVTGLVQYPFSRAQRIEFAAGARRISFDNTIERRFFASNGQFLGDEEVELARPDSLNLGEGSAALVYDSSVFGATGPILGQRYRFEYSQTAGSLRFAGILADYRKYFMPVRPFTVALRGLHYGRYGRDGEDARLSPLYLGYPGMVRGYEIGSFDPVECGNQPSQCPVFDQLVGSRLALATAELRFPLVGVFSRRTFYGPLPIEIALFGDAGVAWTSDIDPSFLGGPRDLVRSAGAAIRFNLFGYLIGEIDYVRPLDRPGRGWMWQFNLTPGF
jgi:Tol biopolymer transport system component